MIHPSCYKALFSGRKVSLRLKYDRAQIIREARERAAKMSLGGAQPKVSLTIHKGELEIVSAGGEYLLKPSTETHPCISENEHLCMLIARARKIPIPPICLVELRDGELAYLIKRFDRNKQEKIHLEDFASVLNYPSGSKYEGSYLDIGKAIEKHCRDKGLDKMLFLHVVMLSFLIGNGDLHLKNFSILDHETYYALSPIYDLVCAVLYYPQTEVALQLMPDYQGNLTALGFYNADDFIALGEALELDRRALTSLAASLSNAQSTFLGLLKGSFLNKEVKDQIERIFSEQFKRFNSAKSLAGVAVNILR